MPVLPPKYYLTYFEFLLQFVERQYRNLLASHEIQWLQHYYQLSEEARCAFVRMTNRKGCLFREQKFVYTEINDLPAALQELLQQGFCSYLTATHTTEYADYLELFSKDELLQYLAKTNLVTTKDLKSWKKEKVKSLHVTIQKNITFHDFYSSHPEKIICQCHDQLIAFFRFLFFGNQYQDMTEFVVRDMGILKYENFDEGKFVPLFTDRAEAEEKWRVIEALRLFYEMKNEEIHPLQIYDYFRHWLSQNKVNFAVSQLSYDRMVLKIGEWLEKNKLWEEAISLYEFTTLPPARQKRARLLFKIGETANATSLCEMMLVQAQNAEELLFAKDFLAKQQGKQRPLKTVTQHLKEAEWIVISPLYKYKVEMGVIEYFQAKGWNGVYVENYVWRCLFGLVFWDIVFDVNIHHPLQRRPSDFYSPLFFEHRQAKFMARLATLQRFEDLQQLLQHHYEEKWGIANPLMQWHEATLPLVYLVASLVPLDSLKEVWLAMAKNLQAGTKGFPDILIWKATTYQFIEVKSVTDNLSAQQLYWLQFFGQVGIHAKVLRVDFAESHMT